MVGVQAIDERKRDRARVDEGVADCDRVALEAEVPIDAQRRPARLAGELEGGPIRADLTGPSHVAKISV